MENRPLRIALTKGRLEEKAVQLFGDIGYDCDRLINKGRKLVIDIGGLEIVLVKAADVITYVENGACDMGVVGKDTILEYGKSFYEILDLGFGKCRMMVAVKKGTDFYSGYSRKKIATKFVNIARDYYNKKGMDVDIIRIEGSVELAPLLGLADAIVDIVETGVTLKENGLEVIEEVCPLSARLIVNTACMKLRREEVLELTEKIERWVDRPEGR